MENNKDNIADILADFEKRKGKKDSQQEQKEAPEQIDFAKSKSDIRRESKNKKRELLKSHSKTKIKKAKEKLHSADFKKRLIKIIAIVLCAVSAVSGLITGVVIGMNKNKTAYLKPYIEKYPDVKFPQGILEQYCDDYAKNKDMAGYIEINAPDFKSVVQHSSNKKLPYLESNTKGSETFNTVIYMQDNSLEEYYSSIDSFSKTDGYITYSDLFSIKTYKIAGVFYTNTKKEDDNGYIFPYNVTEKMTTESHKNFADRMNSRLLYKTLTVSRQDELLTISCPTDYEKDFRFVIVAVARSGVPEKSKALPNSKIHYPQKIYDKMHQKNPYELSSEWYPEIVINNGKDNQKTVKQNIDDYK